MAVGERRPHRGDDRRKTGLPQRDHVGIPLDDDRPILAGDRLLGEIEAVQEVALAEQLALRRVDVLRLQRVVPVELPGLEAADASAPVGQRKDDPALEVVVASPVCEPHREKLLLRVALLHRTRSEPRTARRVAEPELAADLLAETARREILARSDARLRLPEHAPIELRGALEQCPEPVVAPPLLLLLGRCFLVLELDAEAAGQRLDRADEVEVLRLLDERDRVAALAAAEALERPTPGRHGEARRPLLVEGAQALVRASCLAEAHDLLDEREDLHRRLDALDRFVLDARHQSSSAA
jgi:hypothetical protein